VLVNAASGKATSTLKRGDLIWIRTSGLGACLVIETKAFGHFEKATPLSEVVREGKEKSSFSRVKGEKTTNIRRSRRRTVLQDV